MQLPLLTLALVNTLLTLPAAAPPVDGSVGKFGATLSSGYATELWASDAVDNDTGLRVVSRTATGTYALTGVVIDDASGTPVSDALVRLTTACIGCGTLRTVTNATGAFAFVNVPAGSVSRLSVRAIGFGPYDDLDHNITRSEEYQATVALTDRPQAYDESSAPVCGSSCGSQ